MDGEIFFASTLLVEIKKKDDFCVKSSSVASTHN